MNEKQLMDVKIWEIDLPHYNVSRFQQMSKMGSCVNLICANFIWTAYPNICQYMLSQEFYYKL